MRRFALYSALEAAALSACSYGKIRAQEMRSLTAWLPLATVLMVGFSGRQAAADVALAVPLRRTLLAALLCWPVKVTRCMMVTEANHFLGLPTMSSTSQWFNLYLTNY